MKKLEYRRVFTFVGLISLSLVYGLLWSSMIRNPKVRTGSDFMGFYSYGRISQTLGYGSIFDIHEQQKVQEQVVGFPVVPIFYTHLPFIAPLAVLLVNEDFVSSFNRWAMVLLSLNLVNVFLLMKMVNRSRFSLEQRVILGAGLFLFFPTFSGLMNGQDTQILLLGAVIWVAGIFSGKHFLAGLGLSLMTIRPQVALFLAIPFFFRRRNVFWGFVVGSLALAGLSLVLIKLDGASQFIQSIRYIESTVWIEPHALDMPTISGIIRRNFSFADPGPVRSFVWACYLAGIIAFCVIWCRRAEIAERQVCLISACAIFLLPYAHYHDLVLLLIPIVCLVRILERENLVKPDYLAEIPLILSWLAALGFAGSGYLKFPIMYGVMLVLIVLSLKPDLVLRVGRNQPAG
ncbi:MAG: DUF2029 domain-containing protein [Chloroflexi bacterium]|nr:DUF2029 domain-containing protein [Chloroflexota bacterium]